MVRLAPGRLVFRRVVIGGVKMEANMAWEESAMVESKPSSKDVQILWLRVLLKPASSLITTFIMGRAVLSFDDLSRERAE